MFLIYEIRNPRLSEHLPGKASVLLQVSGDHCDLSIAAAFFPDKPCDPPCSLLHLRKWTHCGKHADLILLLLIYILSVTEDIFFQKIEGRSLGKTRSFYVIQQNRILNIPGKLRKPVDHLPAHIKKLVRLPPHSKILCCVHGDRHHHFLTDREQFSHHPHLDRRKTCIAIQKQHTALHLLRKRQGLLKGIHHLFPCHIMILQISGKSLIKNRYVLKLHLQQCPVSRILYHLLNVTVLNIVLHKLGQNGFHLIQISGLAHLSAKIREIFAMLLDHFLKHHALASLFQQCTAVASNLLQNTVCQTLKT